MQFQTFGVKESQVQTVPAVITMKWGPVNFTNLLHDVMNNFIAVPLQNSDAVLALACVYPLFQSFTVFLAKLYETIV